MTAPASPQRRRLGQALRNLRRDAVLTGVQLGEATGISQSSISRFELGQELPTEDEVKRVAQAAHATAKRVSELLDLRDEAASQQTPWRKRLRGGLAAVQQETGELERSAATIQCYTPTIVPGLCHTPDYARAVREARGLDRDPEFTAALQAALDRRQILFEPGRRFEFVIGEPALRWRLGPPPMMLAQVDRLAQVASMPNVDVRVLPLDAQTLVWHTHGFVVFDREHDPVVHLECLTGEVNLFDPDEVKAYVVAFERLMAAAVAGSDLGRLLARVAAGLRG